MIATQETEVGETIHWQRADPIALSQFDESTKQCTMNCGPHREDPRSRKERKFLCEDCVIRNPKQN
jgi:hypothetical protein